jgi:hypothetical protein
MSVLPASAISWRARFGLPKLLGGGVDFPLAGGRSAL